MSASQWFFLNVQEIIQETESAFLLRDEDEEDHWIPKSQICDPGDYCPGDKEVTIGITEWIARQKGFDV